MTNKLNSLKNEEVKAKILVCYYQPWQIPKEDIFFPIQAGKAISGFSLKMQGDDTGDNISIKNSTFSEFTAWYWGWKNIKALYPNIEYVGLSHYRRFFALNEYWEHYAKIDKDRIPKMENYENLIRQKLDSKDIILVKQASFQCNLKTQYGFWHNISDYFCMKDIIHEIYPEYDESWKYVFENNNAISLYCLFIARYELFNKYFEWLFPLLFEAEKRIDVSKYDSDQKRVFAYLAERLLNVYVYHNKLKVLYEPIYFINCEKKIYPSKPNVKIIFKKIIEFIMPYGIAKWYKKNICC